ncbi:unnamed protein product [Lymnaea stagnalis]|uniref:Transmembrane protein 232 n=1 Tax=Lymnaea stagnalis TaxID=6523 RepID=A0AAV2I6S3_LYMST
MPFTKVPVVHKFGIISSTQRIELQERLLRQTFHTSSNSKKATLTQRNTLEVSEEFVHLFNNAENHQKDKYEEKARKLLERSKRRSGLKKCGQGSHVNLPLAWTELVQLAQCKGRLQEECLDALVVSLDVSPLEKCHIPALFFLAETMLYKIRTESVLQPFLKIGEIKLLKMGQLVFERLFYHHMAGQLQGHVESKNRLCTYIEGLQDYQQLYSPYPNALLSLRFVTEVGKIILADIKLQSVGNNRGDNLLNAPKHNMEELSLVTKNLFESQSHDEGHNLGSGAISSSVHDLSPTLWHALDVWRCTHSISGGLRDALRALAHCGAGLSSETWIDGMVAIQILGETAKTNMGALKVLYLLTKGVKDSESLLTTPTSSRSETSGIHSDASSSGEELDTQEESSQKSNSPLSESGTRSSLSDIFERSEEGEVISLDSASLDSGSSKGDECDRAELNWPIFGSRLFPKFQTQQNDLFINNLPDKDTTKGEAENRTQDEAYLNNGEVFELSVLCHQLIDTPGILGWHWEVALTYAEVLASIVIYGSSAEIQKHALMGDNDSVEELLYHCRTQTGFNTSPVRSAGLLDLLFFNLKEDINDEGNDWSWKVRFGAVQALVNMCRSLEGDILREGLRTTAWHFLLKANAMEKDLRVIEALKVGQVHADTSSFLDAGVREHPPSIGGRIASGLSVIYLPPIPPPTTASPIKKTTYHPQVAQQLPFKNSLEETRPMRTSLKQEIDLATALYEKAPDYNTRKSFDLRRIVEDQWRKELQSNLKLGEEDEMKEVMEKQKNEEERQRQVAEVKLNKLSKKRSS